MAWMLLPSVYLLVRMRLATINAVDINILGQMEWFDLIDEILVTTLTIPLYSLLRAKKDNGGAGKNTAAFLASFAVYAAFTALAVLRISGIAAFMNAAGAERYLAAETVSMLIGFVSAFCVLLITVNSDESSVRNLTLVRLAALVAFDVILIPKRGDVGAAYSDIAANAVAAGAALTLCLTRGYFGKPAFRDGAFFASWAKRGAFAGVQIFLDNFIYAIMICKMVNAVNEAGNYWAANNFIWGWLLVPVTCFAELIRKNDLERLDLKNTWRYGLVIAGAWAISVPIWPWFIRNAMSMESADTVLRIVYPSVVFYLAYIPSAFIDGWLVSRGKTWCLTAISAAVNLGYYGILYRLYQKGAIEPSMAFIISMFGWGMVVHLLLSAAFYLIVRRPRRRAQAAGNEWIEGKSG